MIRINPPSNLPARFTPDEMRASDLQWIADEELGEMYLRAIDWLDTEWAC